MAQSAQCARCSRRISELDMEEGLVVQTAKGFYCAECARYVKDVPGSPTISTSSGATLSAGEEPAETLTDEPPSQDEEPTPVEEPPPSPRPDEDSLSPEEDPVALLQRILDEIRPISRAALYEKASIWNVLGGVGQIFALTLLLFAVILWNAATTNLLLVALLVQLMTLTCFVRGK